MKKNEKLKSAIINCPKIEYEKIIKKNNSEMNKSQIKNIKNEINEAKADIKKNLEKLNKRTSFSVKKSKINKNNLNIGKENETKSKSKSKTNLNNINKGNMNINNNRNNIKKDKANKSNPKDIKNNVNNNQNNLKVNINSNQAKKDIPKDIKSNRKENNNNYKKNMKINQKKEEKNDEKGNGNKLGILDDPKFKESQKAINNLKKFFNDYDFDEKSEENYLNKFKKCIFIL